MHVGLLSRLLIPLGGFLPPADPRVRGTVEAIERGLPVDGLIQRYWNVSDDDGLPCGEGAFLPCSFWPADNRTLIGRHNEAVALVNTATLLSLPKGQAQRSCTGGDRPAAAAATP